MTELSTLGRMLLEQAEEQPGKTAITFRSRWGEAPTARTYEELVRRAAAMAARLEACSGEPVVLALPSGMGLVDGLFGVWLAGAIAVPAMPPRAGRRGDRLLGILRDVRPRVVVTSTECREAVGRAVEEAGLGPELVLVEEVPEGAAPVDPSDEDIALVQYTSGSVGHPKGVVLSHANILANQAQIAANFGHRGDSVVAGWLPMHHDMGLANILQPLFCGAETHLMPPEMFLMRPQRWLELMDETGATTSGGPNFAYDLCASRVPAEVVAGLDLSRWEVAFNGAEPVRAATLARFARLVAPAGFRPTAIHPCYGLAEASLIVAGKEPGTSVGIIRREGEATPRVSCGRAVREVELAIVNPESGIPAAEGAEGELWVRGPNVSRGYWGRDGDPAFGQSLGGRDDWMRTGDVGCLLGGELMVTGRLKDVIIVGGQNHAAEDLEHAAQEALGLGSDMASAAFSVEGDAGEEVVIVVESPRRESRRMDDREAAAVGKALTEAFEIRATHLCIVPRGRLPRTTSGKVRRNEIRHLFLNQQPPFESLT